MKTLALAGAYLLIVLCLAFAVLAQGDGDDVISVDSSVVLVNVTVTGKDGKTFAGLTEKQFTLLEDGTLQKIDSFTAESTPFAAVVLLDTSGSMESRISIARGAVIRFLEGIRSQDSAAILNFDSKVNVIREFSSSSILPDVFFDLKADGMTVLNDAIVRASELLSKRPEKRRAIIILSDGEDTRSLKSDDKALKIASAVGATLYTVDMSSPDTPLASRVKMQAALKKFAERSGGTYIATPGGPEMRTAFARIAEELGNQYTLSYSPAAEKRDGKFHSIEVRVSKPNLTIRTRKGYNAPKAK